MHSFPQFTRSTLCEEFPGVGAIIFGGNFMVRGQFSSGAIVQNAWLLQHEWSALHLFWKKP